MDVVKAGVASLLLACLPVAAFSAAITGSFSGVADGWRMVGPGEQWFFEDEPIAGTFAFASEYDEADVYDSPESVMYFGWPVAVSFDLFGYTTFFDPDPGSYAFALTLGESQQQQTAELWFFAAYSNASLSFVAPSGGLFDRFDPRTFNPNAVDVAASHANFSGHTRSGYASVRFDRITFDGYTPAPIPEPMTLGLLAMGVFGMGWARSRRGLGRQSR